MSPNCDRQKHSCFDSENDTETDEDDPPLEIFYAKRPDTIESTVSVFHGRLDEAVIYFQDINRLQPKNTTESTGQNISGSKMPQSNRGNKHQYQRRFATLHDRFDIHKHHILVAVGRIRAHDAGSREVDIVQIHIVSDS